MSHDVAVEPWVEVVDVFAERLAGTGWVTALWVAGSAASGDHHPGVSDLDLVALVDGPVDAARRAVLTELHLDLDAGVAAGADLGCAYVDEQTLADVDALHPTWTHGRWATRSVSRITRAELARFGTAVTGRPPQDVLPPADERAVREAALAEVTGYWAWAARRPWIWLDPVIAELGLTAMARGRYAMETGELLTKTAAIEHADAPPWLVEHLRARRRGEQVRPPRVRTAVIAWRDARRTVAGARQRP